MEIKRAFKFCLCCGSQAEAKEKYLHCPKCGFDFYFNPKPTQSVILINDRKEILFAVRAAEPRKGYLDFPGGFVDEDEDYEESVRREVKEELGIKIGKLHYLVSDYDEYLFQGVNYKVMGVTYYGLLPKSSKPQPRDDVSAIEFYKLEDVPTGRLAWESMHRLLIAIKPKLG